MKDSEFIELLNLYLDHEITAADAARLESEVLGNPARRLIYEDYCRMQKACKVLAHQFETEAASAGEEGKVVPFETGHTTRRAGWYLGGIFAAAAACAAIVFVVQSRQPATEAPAPAASVAAAPAAAPASESKVMLASTAPATDRSIGRTVTIPAREQSPRVMTTLLLSSAGTSRQATFAGADQAAPQFDWMHDVQLAPLQRTPIEQFRFDPRTSTPDNRAYLNNRQGPLEWTAIRWQK
jgi:hypothetical protein